MTVDANQIGQEERRKAQFSRWLIRAWEWAIDTSRYELAAKVDDLLRHFDEEDYPIWEKAGMIGVIGEGKTASILRKKFGNPILGPKMIGWEREINFSPVIAIDEKVWDFVYAAMGWANRTADTNWPVDNFYLWSPAGNIVRFIKKVKVEEPE